MKLLALDISGNFKEGKGTTGICRMIDGEVRELTDLKASDFSSDVEYWAAHEDYIQSEWPDHIVVEGYRLYNHKGMAAKTQANSDLETPQLLGIIKHVAYRMNIPLTVQYATEIKTRWADNVLVHLGILQENESKTRLFFKGEMTTTHRRDALKHALHFNRYKKEKL